MSATKRVFTVILAAGLFTFGFSMCAGPNGPTSDGDGPSAAETALRVVSPSPAFARGKDGRSIADVAESAVASVVNIASEKIVHNEMQEMRSPFFSDPFFRHFFGGPFGGPGGPGGRGGRGGIPREQRQKSLGSGVIISADGIVVTNNHVVEKADTIRVTLADERELEAEVIGTDPKSDLAVLRLKGGVKDLKPLEFGDSSRLRLGEVVLAIGNPFGVGQTVTMGIVSAKGRADVGIVDYEDFIQTDAAINPGNSGGALVDLEGKLVGINTAIVSRSGGYQGIGFAIPSNMVEVIEESLVAHGKVTRGWLGVAIQDVDAELANALGLSSTKGVLISDVVDDSPAAEAEIERGDVVLAVDGEAVDSTGRLRSLIAIQGPERKVSLRLLRDGKEMTVEVTLGELPDDVGGSAEIDRDEGILGGLKVSAVNAQTRETYELPRAMDKGVVIVEVEPGSPAQRAGFKAGDVILEVNRQSVTSASEFGELYRKSGSRVLLLVYRQGRTTFLVLPKK